MKVEDQGPISRIGRYVKNVKEHDMIIVRSMFGDSSVQYKIQAFAKSNKNRKLKANYLDFYLRPRQARKVQTSHRA